MGPLSWLRSKRRRESTRAEIENFLELGCPGGSELDRLRWLVDWIFRNSPHSYNTTLTRADHRGVSAHMVDRLRSGDVAFDLTWGLIERVLEASGAPRAAIEVAHDLFRNFPRPARAAAERIPSGNLTGQNCLVLLTDVVGFSTRTDQDRGIIRRAMYQIVLDSFTAAGISPDHYREDRGDGILFIIKDVAPKQIVHRLLTHITEKLSRYNADAEGGARFKLRVALDVGPVESDANGVNGQVIINVTRLIDARPFKQRLAKSPPGTCLGFIASEFVYQSVIKQYPVQLFPDKYEQISVRAKKSRLNAWIKLAPDTADSETADEQTDP
jgi:hypothetical protein